MTLTARRVCTEILIRSPRTLVWELLSNLNSYSAWNPIIPEAAGNLIEGQRLALLFRAPGLMERRVSVKVLRVNPEAEILWVGRTVCRGLLDGYHSFTLLPAESGLTRLIQNETFTGILAPLLAPCLLPNMRRAFGQMNDAIKSTCEGFRN